MERKTFKSFARFISILLVIATLLTGSLCYTAFAIGDMIALSLSPQRDRAGGREAALQAPEKENVALPTVPEEKEYDITYAVEYRFSQICGKYDVYSNCPEEEKAYLYSFLANGTDNEKELNGLYQELERSGYKL